MELLIVTGMSGAGKSAVVDALEDAGYFCADNMIPSLIPIFANFLAKSDTKKKLATVTDIRVGEKALEEFNETFETLNQMNIKYKILFVDAENSVLVRRYKETRRRHPLIDACEGSLPAAVESEREKVDFLRRIADFRINTSNSSVNECKQRVNELFVDSPEESMRIRCISFGFKHGTPGDADILFDVRCLPNPFYVPSMKEHTGLQQDVRDYVMGFEESKTLLNKLNDLIEFLVPLYIEEGKSQLVIAVGCTGGRHRSVCFAEQIGRNLINKGYNTRIKHRDIDK